MHWHDPRNLLHASGQHLFHGSCGKIKGLFVNIGQSRLRARPQNRADRSKKAKRRSNHRISRPNLQSSQRKPKRIGPTRTPNREGYPTSRRCSFLKPSHLRPQNESLRLTNGGNRREHFLANFGKFAAEVEHGNSEQFRARGSLNHLHHCNFSWASLRGPCVMPLSGSIEGDRVKDASLLCCKVRPRAPGAECQEMVECDDTRRSAHGFQAGTEYSGYVPEYGPQGQKPHYYLPGQRSQTDGQDTFV